MYITLQLRIRKTEDGYYQPGFVVTEFRENRPPAEHPFWCQHAAQAAQNDATNAARALAYAQIGHQYPHFINVKELDPQLISNGEEGAGETHGRGRDPDVCPEKAMPGALRNVLEYQQRMLMRRRKDIQKRRRSHKRMLARERPSGY